MHTPMKKTSHSNPSAVSSPTQAVNSLADLKQLKKELQQRTQQAEEEKKRAQEQARKARAEQNLFRSSMGDVTPLKNTGRVVLRPPKPTPHPKQREQDEQRVLQESLSDEFDVESLLDTDEALSFRQSGIGTDVVRKLRRGHWALQAQLDLHGYRRDEAREALSAFLREATKQGLRCVRIVHGKGLGSPGKTPVLKTWVMSWLAQKNDVLAYTQARAAEGGAGALIVLLRTSQPV